jgi:hypothetical protein
MVLPKCNAEFAAVETAAVLAAALLDILIAAREALGLLPDAMPLIPLPGTRA